jgi:hypothetical protein
MKGPLNRGGGVPILNGMAQYAYDLFNCSTLNMQKVAQKNPISFRKVDGFRSV